MRIKRPGRTFKRRQNRKHRNRDRELSNKSAVIIQTHFRIFLSKRYKDICPNNYDDSDYINLEKVSNIPKNLLVTIDGTGYNALSLLGWFCCKQVDPLTRKPICDKIPTECAAKILSFMKNDHTLKKKKGHFKLRKTYREAIQKSIR